MKTIKQLFSKWLNNEQTTRTQDTYYFRVYMWQARLPMTAYEKLVYAFIFGYNQQNKGFATPTHNSVEVYLEYRQRQLMLL